MDLGTKIKNIRKSKNITQSELAEKLGVSTCYVCYLETGKKKNPSYSLMATINQVLNTSIYDLDLPLQPIELSRVSTKDLIEELQKRNDFKIQLIYKEA